MDTPDRSREEDPPPPLPTTFVPRWLAALVLVALLTAGVASAWIILSAP